MERDPRTAMDLAPHDGPAGLNAVLHPEELTPWEKVHPRAVCPEQWKRYEGYMKEIFGAFGMDLDTHGTAKSPERFLTALFDSTSGYEGDSKLLTAFPTECRGGPD